MCNAAVAAISPPAIEQGFSGFETARSWIKPQVRTKSLSFVVLLPRMFLSGRPPVFECNLQPALCSAGDDVCRMLCRSSGSLQVRRSAWIFQFGGIRQLVSYADDDPSVRSLGRGRFAVEGAFQRLLVQSNARGDADSATVVTFGGSDRSRSAGGRVCSELSSRQSDIHQMASTDRRTVPRRWTDCSDTPSCEGHSPVTCKCLAESGATLDGSGWVALDLAGYIREEAWTHGRDGKGGPGERSKPVCAFLFAFIKL